MIPILAGMAAEVASGAFKLLLETAAKSDALKTHPKFAAALSGTAGLVGGLSGGHKGLFEVGESVAKALKTKFGPAEGAQVCLDVSEGRSKKEKSFEAQRSLANMEPPSNLPKPSPGK